MSQVGVAHGSGTLPRRPIADNIMEEHKLEQDLARIAVQERTLVLSRFDSATAWSLGCALRSMADERGAAVTIEIRVACATVFMFTMPGCTPVNADWARRKRNTVELLHRSSYGIGCELRRDAASLEETLGLSTRDYASHGGSFPLTLDGMGCVGAVTVSGLPQRADHELVVEALAGLCNVALADIALTRR